MPTLTFDYHCSPAQLGRIVDASPTPELLQMAAWAQVKAENWDSERFGIRADGELVGACQILFRRLANRRALTVAYTARGPVFTTADVPEEWYRLTYAEAERVARRHRALVMHVDPPVLRANARQLYRTLRLAHYTHAGFYTDMREIQPRAAMMIELSGAPDKLDQQLPKKMRQHVRRATKRPFIYRTVDADHLDDFVYVIDEMADRQSIAMRQREYFATLLNAFGDRVTAQVAYLDIEAARADAEKSLSKQREDLEAARKVAADSDDEAAAKRVANLERGIERLEAQCADLASRDDKPLPLACTLVIYTGDRATYLYGGSTNDYRNYRAPYALIYRCMQQAAEHFDGKPFVFDFGGVSGETDPAKDARHGGLYEFKSSWGAHMVEYVGEFHKPILPVLGHAFTPATLVYKKVHERIRLAKAGQDQTESAQ
ncbi:MAG: peptidoglycan bridge formation glycyltransferase FemA/FemB family protein [Actinomycetaceae bacterium]|nr:peptidoglycan bridge formation glycyltransferase FemA/FemB family protein [Actinomycetaceae bacterium]MDU0969517.1 peptidoglycan bridge formation glycyltransferase FemA/FemB family protein [Actinomycetaceae bacterium]